MSNRAHSGVRLGIQTDHETAEILLCREAGGEVDRRDRLAHTALQIDEHEHSSPDRHDLNTTQARRPKVPPDVSHETSSCAQRRAKPHGATAREAPGPRLAAPHSEVTARRRGPVRQRLTTQLHQRQAPPLAQRRRRNRDDENTPDPYERQSALGQLRRRPERARHGSVESPALAARRLFERLVGDGDSFCEPRRRDRASRHVAAPGSGVHQPPARPRQFQGQKQPQRASAGPAVHEPQPTGSSPLFQHVSGCMFAQRLDRV